MGESGGLVIVGCWVGSCDSGSGGEWCGWWCGGVSPFRLSLCFLILDRGCFGFDALWGGLMVNDL